MLNRYRLLAVNGWLLLVLAGAHWGQQSEAAIPAPPADFLGSLELPFRELKAESVLLTDREKSLLEPDSVLVRQYSSGKQFQVELAVIAGRKKRTVHTPGFCLAGGGWETASQQQQTLHLAGRDVPVIRSVVVKDRVGMLVTYFFTNGDFCSASLPQYQWIQVCNRVRGHSPLGALVRIRVPVLADPARAVELSDDFARAVVPPVLERLRGARAGR